MKVILLEDVKALGKKGQIVNVNDGYARNFILPKKLGVEANNKNLNDLKQLKEAITTLGTHNVPVKLHTKVTAELKVVVKEA